MTDTPPADYFAAITVPEEHWRCPHCGTVAMGQGATREQASMMRRKVWYHHSPRCLLAAIIRAGWVLGICGETAPRQQLRAWAADEAAALAPHTRYRDLAVDTAGGRIDIDMERSTQSTAGNNILSQTEHDAAVSHVQCWRQCTPDKTPVATALTWLAGNPPGTPLTRADTDEIFAAMFRTQITEGREGEAQRLERALTALLGIETPAR